MRSVDFRRAYEALGSLNKDEGIPEGDPWSTEFQNHPVAAGSTFALITGANPMYADQMEEAYRQPGVDTYKLMGQHLAQLGIRHEPTEGKYGAVEPTYIAYNPTRREAIDLARKLGQESVIYSTGGKHEFIYVHGDNAGTYHPAMQGKAGTQFFRNPPADVYTKVPGVGYMRLNFDWNTRMEVPKGDFGHKTAQPAAQPAPAQETQAPESAQPMQPAVAAKSERSITKRDIAKALAKSIQTRIDVFTKELAGLRERELAKSGDEAIVAGMAPQDTGFALSEPNICSNEGANMISGICPTCGNNDAPETCTCLDESRDVILKSEDYIDLKNANEPGKRLKEVPGPHAGVVPDDVTTKDTKGDEGSGGQIKKGSVAAIRKGAMEATKKAEVPMAKPPTKNPTPAKPPMSKAIGDTAPNAGGRGGAPRVPASPAAAPKMSAAGIRGTPANKIKLPGVGLARPAIAGAKPAVPAVNGIKAPTPKPAGAAPKLNAMGKAEAKESDNLGDCALCKKKEHSGDCAK